jgi:hypothetical protein
MTLRDAFWGAKKVMSFSDDDIRAVVESGRLTNHAAENRLVDILTKRRDKIGRYWFDRINPLDKFSVKYEQSKLTLLFSDLGVDGNLYNASATGYSYRAHILDTDQTMSGQAAEPNITIEVDPLTPETTSKPQVIKFELKTRRLNVDNSPKSVNVYVAIDQEKPRVVGIHREI